MNSNVKDRRSVQLEGRVSVGPPLNHSECPLNVKNQRSDVSVDDRASDNDVISYSEDTLSDLESISLEKVCLPQLVTLVDVLKMTY